MKLRVGLAFLLLPLVCEHWRPPCAVRRCGGHRRHLLRPTRGRHDDQTAAIGVNVAQSFVVSCLSVTLLRREWWCHDRVTLCQSVTPRPGRVPRADGDTLAPTCRSVPATPPVALARSQTPPTEAQGTATAPRSARLPCHAGGVCCSSTRCSSSAEITRSFQWVFAATKCLSALNFCGFCVTICVFRMRTYHISVSVFPRTPCLAGAARRSGHATERTSPSAVRPTAGHACLAQDHPHSRQAEGRHRSTSTSV